MLDKHYLLRRVHLKNSYNTIAIWLIKLRNFLPETERVALMVESCQETTDSVVQYLSSSVALDALPEQTDHCSACLLSWCHTGS